MNEMSSSSPPDPSNRGDVIREIVVPGDLLVEGQFKPGNGTYIVGEKIYAARLGIKSIRSDFVNIIPLKGKYVPRAGDLVVGEIIDITPTSWLVDINSPYPAPLHSSVVPWKVDFGDTSRFLNVGDTVLVMVQNVDEIMRIQVSMRVPGERNLRKLNGGAVITISPTKVPRVIGKGGSMISLLKEYTDCQIFVGQNGRIWISGILENMTLVERAIEKIESDAHVMGLTDEVRKLLEAHTKSREQNSEEETIPSQTS